MSQVKMSQVKRIALLFSTVALAVVSRDVPEPPRPLIYVGYQEQTLDQTPDDIREMFKKDKAEILRYTGWERYCVKKDGQEFQAWTAMGFRWPHDPFADTYLEPHVYQWQEGCPRPIIVLPRRASNGR